MTCVRVECRSEADPTASENAFSKAEASGDQPSEQELEAIRRAIDRLQDGLNRIQTETDTWAVEPVEG